MFKLDGKYYHAASDLHGWNTSVTHVLESTTSNIQCNGNGAYAQFTRERLRRGFEDGGDPLRQRRQRRRRPTRQPDRQRADGLDRLVRVDRHLDGVDHEDADRSAERRVG
jgi:hypothetical protein